VHLRAVQPTVADLEAAAARLPLCTLPVVDTTAWPRHSIPNAALSLRLPPGYAPDGRAPSEPFEAPPGEAMQGWSGPDGGYVSVMVDGLVGGTFVLQPEGVPVGRTDDCRVRLLGRWAQLHRAAFATPSGRDTLYVATLDVPLDEDAQLGAGIMHLRPGARDSLAAALNSLEFERLRPAA
jgi:hypothetical protein